MNEVQRLIQILKQSKNEKLPCPLDDSWKASLMKDLRENHFPVVRNKIIYVDFNEYAWKFAACSIVIAVLLAGSIFFQSGSPTGYLYASVFWDEYTNISMM